MKPAALPRDEGMNDHRAQGRDARAARHEQDLALRGIARKHKGPERRTYREPRSAAKAREMRTPASVFELEEEFEIAQTR